MLTLLSGHAIGRQRSTNRLLTLTSSFVFGAGSMTILLLCLFALVANSLLASRTISLEVTWTIICGGALGLALAVFLFYYRKEAGTALWVPRQMVRFLGRRVKATKHSAEAFSLGLSSVLGELLFLALPMAIAALALVQLPPYAQLLGVGLYAATSLSSLGIIHILISGGHSISKLQRWREKNKGFLQFAAGAGLLALGFYVYVDQVMTVAVLAAERAAW